MAVVLSFLPHTPLHETTLQDSWLPLEQVIQKRGQSRNNVFSRGNTPLRLPIIRSQSLSPTQTEKEGN